MSKISKTAPSIAVRRIGVLEPKVLKRIGEESRRNGTDTLSSRETDRIIRAARKRKSNR
jgi:hypothetical protein